MDGKDVREDTHSENVTIDRSQEELVHPEHQRRGIGTKIMREILTVSRRSLDPPLLRD